MSFVRKYVNDMASYSNSVPMNKLENESSIYHFHPPPKNYSQFRDTPNLFHSHDPSLYGLEEQEFKRKGSAIIIDDNVYNGRTLKRAFHYLHSLGYDFKDIFV